jgi:hypothetical protein
MRPWNSLIKPVKIIFWLSSTSLTMRMHNFNLGLLNLKKFKPGWEGYEWRWKSKTFRQDEPSDNLPLGREKGFGAGFWFMLSRVSGDQILH